MNVKVKRIEVLLGIFTDEFSILTDRKKLLLMSLSLRCGGMSGVVAMSGGYRDRTLSSHGCKDSKMASKICRS